MRVLIIAEAGVNHNGDLGLAKKLVDAAAEAGADLVKFQTFKADDLVVAGAKKADYQTRTTGGGESQREMLRRLELTPEMHRDLVAHCRKRGIGFFSTGFDAASVDFLASLGAERFKVPSGEITNLPLLRHIGRYGKDVILSTGMATLEEVGAAIRALEKAGTPKSRITVLHCNTEYPTPLRDANVRAMTTLASELGCAVGYSDHTAGIDAAVAAAALGATVIEKHFTLDRTLPGPDHAASLEPDELAALVTAVRNVELALGDGKKIPTESEKPNIDVARRSLVAAQPIAKGAAFTEKNVAAKRPGGGISPMRWDEIIGMRAPRDFAVDEQIET